ncbi:MAG: hypothetical protein JWN38_847 [Candidatus Saccharibacteria bacterium]|nr:hypothetical protein [Candidatus Saccharibacteria bacterium]
MTPNIILAAIVLVPVVVLMALRINAALVFLSLCLGNVLVQFVADDANWFVSLVGAAKAGSSVASGNNLIKIILLLLPTVLTAVFMIRTVHGKARLALNILPAAGVGLLGGLLIVPLLSAGLSHNIVGSSVWHQVSMAQDLIVGVSALICLFVLWLQRPKAGHDEKHHKL